MTAMHHATVHVAKVFYVSPDGSDSATGSRSAPWLTIGKAMRKLQPGQMAYVRAGVYVEQDDSDNSLHWTKNGSATAPITISGYPGEEHLVLVKTQLHLEGAYLRLMNLTVDRNTHSTGLDGPGGGDVNVWLSGVGDRLTGCDVRNSTMSAVFIDAPSGVRVARCHLHDNGRHDYLDHGIYCAAGTGHVIENNVIENNYAFGIQLFPDCDSCTVRANTIAKNRRAGVIVSGDDNVTANNNVIDNNVLAFNGEEGLRTGSTGLVTSGNTANKNVLFGNNTSGNGAGQTWLPQAGLTITNTISTDPMLKSVAAGDYDLLPGSSAVGAATANMPALDYYGAPRGDDPDVGALQSGFAGGTVPVASNTADLSAQETHLLRIARQDVAFDGKFVDVSASQWVARAGQIDVKNSGVLTGSGFALSTDTRTTGFSGAFTAGATDGTNTNRTEVQSYTGSVLGDDDYFAWSTKLPTGFTTPSWANLLQLFSREFTIANRVMFRFGITYATSGPAHEWFLIRNPVSVESPGASEITHVLLDGLSVGSWHDWVLRIKWATDTTGVIQVWHRLRPGDTWAKLLDLAGVRTLQSIKADGTYPATVQMRHGLYRAEVADGSARTVLHDCFVKANSFEAAEQAFAGTVSVPRRKIWRVSPAVGPGDAATYEDIVHAYDRKSNAVIGPQLPGAQAFLAFTSDRAYGFRLYNHKAKPINRVSFAMQTANANDDAVEVVVFDETGTVEIFRRVSTGKQNVTGRRDILSTSVGGTEFATFMLADDSVYNVIWMGHVTSGTPTVLARNISSATFADLSGTTVGQKEMFSKATSNPIPANLTGFVSDSQVPIVALATV